METEKYIIAADDPILVTGAAGFIGPAIVGRLLDLGFSNVRAFVRPSSNVTRLNAVIKPYEGERKVEVIQGNLLSRADCLKAADGAAVVIHLATTSDKSFPNAFMNSVITTRNLLDSVMKSERFRRFVNVSSFAVYSNAGNRRWRLLDETAPVEKGRIWRDAYCYAKVKQDECVKEYGEKWNVPYVIVRPGSVYGPGKTAITGRVGIDTFGIFLHMGGFNTIPFTYIDNCADAVVLAGLTPGVDGEVFNIVDTDLLTSRRFLSLYKKKVKPFPSIYVPHAISYLACRMWEWYSKWSGGQLPPTFNRSRWHSEWKSTRYSNQKLRTRLRWSPRVSTKEGMRRYFEACREETHA